MVVAGYSEAELAQWQDAHKTLAALLLSFDRFGHVDDSRRLVACAAVCVGPAGWVE